MHRQHVLPAHTPHVLDTVGRVLDTLGWAIGTLTPSLARTDYQALGVAAGEADSGGVALKHALFLFAVWGCVVRYAKAQSMLR